MAEKLKSILKILEEENQKGEVEKINFADLIEPVSIECDEILSHGSTPKISKKKIIEKVYIASKDELFCNNQEYRISNASDFAIMNGNVTTEITVMTRKEELLYASYWTRSLHIDPDDIIRFAIIDYHGDYFGYDSPSLEDNGTRPMINLNFDKFLSFFINKRNIFNICEVKSKVLIDNQLCPRTRYVLSLGEYPQSFVGKELNDELDDSLNNKTINPTGKKYSGKYIWSDNYKNKKCFEENLEYKYNGERYVKVDISSYSGAELSDGHAYSRENEQHLWVKVEPIRWVIENWKDLPKDVNPSGTGKATTMKLQTEECIIAGVPICKEDNESVWKNSLLRNYLNNYFLKEAFEVNIKDLVNSNSSNQTKNNIQKNSDKEMDEMFDEVDEQLNNL